MILAQKEKLMAQYDYFCRHKFFFFSIRSLSLYERSLFFKSSLFIFEPHCDSHVFRSIQMVSLHSGLRQKDMFDCGFKEDNNSCHENAVDDE